MLYEFGEVTLDLTKLVAVSQPRMYSDGIFVTITCEGASLRIDPTVPGREAPLADAEFAHKMLVKRWKEFLAEQRQQYLHAVESPRR